MQIKLKASNVHYSIDSRLIELLHRYINIPSAAGTDLFYLLYLCHFLDNIFNKLNMDVPLEAEQ